jgi:hypothetical protein
MHRKLYAGQLETITMLKRGDDQAAGTVRRLTLFECRRSMHHKNMQPVQGDMSAHHWTVWHIPRTELDRVGVAHINALDIFIDYSGPEHVERWWEPESTTNISVKLFEDHVCVGCLRRDPPGIQP